MVDHEATVVETAKHEIGTSMHRAGLGRRLVISSTWAGGRPRTGGPRGGPRTGRSCLIAVATRAAHAEDALRDEEVPIHWRGGLARNH
jgi:hypothetical protein